MPDTPVTPAGTRPPFSGRTALNLVLAADHMRMLQLAERQSGAVWVTDAAIRAVSDAVRDFTGACTFPDRVRVRR